MIHGRFGGGCWWKAVVVVALVTSSQRSTGAEESGHPEDPSGITPQEAVAAGPAAGPDAGEEAPVTPEAGPAAEASQATAAAGLPEAPAADADRDAGAVADGPDPAAAAGSEGVGEAAVHRAGAGHTRVRLKLDVTGEIFATVGADAPPLRLPTKLEARFDFIESAGDAAEGGVVVRWDRDAVAELCVAGPPQRVALAADAREVRFALLGMTPAPFLASGHLTREEMDLLETPFDPLLMEAILPRSPVAENEPWVIPPDATAGLLTIDTVESGRVEARVTGVTDGVATVAIEGIVDGAVDGVPTHVTVEGTCVLPVAAGDGKLTLDTPPSSASLTLRERREAGHVAPGFDVEAHVSFARDQASADEAEEASAGGESVRSGGSGRPGLVWHRDRLGRYEIVHDGRWKTIEDGLDGLEMRLVDRGALLAQCSVTALPRGPASAPPTSAEVERDLQRSLAGQATGIEHSSEASRSDGVRIVRVVATGKAGDLPFRWVHAVLTDASGQRVAVTCMLEGGLRDRFGNADRDLVDGISLPRAAAANQDGPGEPIEREARLPPATPTP
ncbi:MAG: hypothetical protein ACKON8_06830 [Planctomycetota bacterium]